MAGAAATATILSIQGAAMSSSPLRRALVALDALVVSAGPDEVVLAFTSAGAAIAAAVSLAGLALDASGPVRAGLAAGDVGWDGDGCTGHARGLATRLAATARPGRVQVTTTVVTLSGLGSVPGPLDVVDPAPPVGDGWRAGLSARELSVLHLVAEGLSNREIGRRLFISPNTAANHVRSILHKTVTSNRAEAVAFAARHGLLAAPP